VGVFAKAVRTTFKLGSSHLFGEGFTRQRRRNYLLLATEGEKVSCGLGVPFEMDRKKDSLRRWAKKREERSAVAKKKLVNASVVLWKTERRIELNRTEKGATGR